MSTFHIRIAEKHDALGMAVVRVETWKATYKGMIPDAFLQALSAEALAENWRKAFWENNDQDLGIFLSEDEQGHIVGIAICGPGQEPDPAYEGEMYLLYVLPAYQNQGIGKALVAACARHLTQALGFKTMLVWVIAENPYRRFYESLGGTFVREKKQQIGGKTITEAGYGWEDIHRLFQES